MYFDGNISNLRDVLNAHSTDIDMIKKEIESIHKLLDELGAPRGRIGFDGDWTGGEIGTRLKFLLESKTEWEKVK